jgi:tetratricopeptide (TPR) repeat protein
MATTTLFPGFLNQVLAYGFRIGSTQIPGNRNIESLWAGGQETLPVEAIDDAGGPLARLQSGTPPLAPGVFLHKTPLSLHPPERSDAPKPPKIYGAPSADQRIAEAFSALLDVLSERMERDVEAAALAMQRGQIPLDDFDPSDYDQASSLFADAADRAQREAVSNPSKTANEPLIVQMRSFSQTISATNLTEILTWSLRTLLYLPPDWKLPAVILQFLTAQIEWKLGLLGPAADTLKELGSQLKALRGPHHDWEMEAHIRYLAGTALFVASYVEIRDSFADASREFQEALQCFEERNDVDSCLRERFALGFLAIAEVLSARGRLEEAAVQYELAAVEAAKISGVPPGLKN